MAITRGRGDGANKEWWAHREGLKSNDAPGIQGDIVSCWESDVIGVEDGVLRVDDRDPCDTAEVDDKEEAMLNKDERRRWYVEEEEEEKEEEEEDTAE